MPGATSLPEKRRRIKSEKTKPEESCGKIMDFFRLLQEMETQKISAKSGRNTCKGPAGSKIEYSYHIKISDPGNKQNTLKNGRLGSQRLRRRLKTR